MHFSFGSKSRNKIEIKVFLWLLLIFVKYVFIRDTSKPSSTLCLFIHYSVVSFSPFSLRIR